MRLGDGECWHQLRTATHGVLGTLHPTRGLDAVPVVYVVAGHQIVIPIDRVKPKGGARLQRLANIEFDNRVVLLVEHYDDDWSTLWWVRVHARATAGAVPDELRAALAARFPAYRPRGAVVSVITLEPTTLTGWSAAALG